MNVGSKDCPETSVRTLFEFLTLECGIETSRNVGKDSFGLLTLVGGIERLSRNVSKDSFLFLTLKCGI